MEAIGVGIAAGVGQDGVKGAVGVIRRHVQYYTCYEENVNQFQSQMNDLEAKQKDLQGKVDAARRNQDEPLLQVLRWLENSEDVISQCEQLQEQIGKKTGRHYWLGRKVVKMMETVTKVIAKYNSLDKTTVACNPPPRRVETTATAYEEGLDTMEVAKKQVMDALRDVDVSVIGVYGMGGVGKTTLMQRVNNELEKSPDLFKKVIMVTVSSNPDIKTLQDKIAERLGLKLDKNKEVPFRANMLSEALKREGSVLVILDDVWEKGVPDRVGVTCGSGNRCCKIVLTTRDQDVCNNAQKKIPLCGLTEKESWKLFRKKVGQVVDQNEIKSIAEKVCKECAGLPLAISAVASSLQNVSSVPRWKKCLNYLKKSEPAMIEGLTKEVINPLRLSYDLLHTEDLKSCFLTCSLFPEDHEIDVRDLMYYGIGEEFVKGGEESDGEEERLTLLDDCLDLVDTLKSRGLLLHVDEGDKMYARMHDVVRDVAISIGKEDGTYGMYVKAGVGETEWPEQTQLQGRKRLSFMKSPLLQHLPGQPRFDTDIKSLLLCYTYSHNSGSFSIPDGFFENMRDLLILDLRQQIGISSLPSSLQNLEKLRVFLSSGSGHKLIGLDVLLALKNLVVLSLNYIPIVELPEEFGGLVHLKILDLTNTRIKIIKPNVLSKLSRLEQLHMLRSFDQWEACNDATGEASTLVQDDRKLASFSELASLKKLKVLKVNVRNGEIFSQDIALSTLKMFCISYLSEDDDPEDDDPEDDDPEPTRLILRSPAPLARWVKLLMTKAAKLTLFDCQEHIIVEKCNELVVVSEFSKFPVLPNLEWLRVASCETLKDVFKYTPTKQEGEIALCPTLAQMTLEGLPQLENIISCTEENITSSLLPAGSFQNLRIIEIRLCDSLCYLFSWSMAMCLVNLERLSLNDCEALKEIICEEGYDDHAHVFPRLKMLSLESLPKLEIRCRFPQQGLDWSPQVLPAGSFQNLKWIEIDSFGSLRYLFSWSTAMCLVKLEVLKVNDCNALKEIIRIQQPLDRSSQLLPAFPRLKELTLWSLPMLEIMCRFPQQPLDWSSRLEVLHLFKCPRLKSSFLSELSGSEIRIFWVSKEWFESLEWEDEHVKNKWKNKLTGWYIHSGSWWRQEMVK